MADTKFTPGPWAWDGDILTAGKTRRHLLYMEEAPGLRSEAAANIHLIAAGPDLYEALQGAIGALEYSVDCARDDGNNSDIDFAQSKLDAAMTALAKARGEANG